MSKIGKKPIAISEGVTVSQENGWFKVSGKLGTLMVEILPPVNSSLEGNLIKLIANDSKKQSLANWGTTAAHLKNAILGVSEGFKKQLEIQGIGFKAAIEGDNLILNLGFSHPIKYLFPEGIKIEVEKNFITVSGIDIQKVGQAAAEIRSFKKPEPYLGKGIRYVGERVRRKQGKKVAGATGGA